MRHFYLIILLLVGLSVSSCKDTEDIFYSNNEQDRDDDVITGDDYVYHLPIIFHVLYQDANAVDKDKKKTQYIPYSRFKTLLDNVNDLYEGQLYHFSYGEDSKSENIHVKFELAQYDESGKKLATPGVEYIKYSGEYPIDCNTFMKQKKGKSKFIWDPNEYINVMVYNFKDTEEGGTVLGISNLPYKANGYPQLEGLEETKKSSLNKNNISFEYCISLNSLYIYNESSRYTDENHGQKGYEYNSADANVTLAHELGHFLGLHHVFAETTTNNGTEPADNCDDTDFCIDTKSYNKIAYDKALQDTITKHNQNKTSLEVKYLIKRKNDQGEEWDSDNIMDYSISLSYRFTPNQKERMRQVLYYSPLMPGPKKNRSSEQQTRSWDNDEVVDLPIRLVEDRLEKSNSTHYQSQK